MNTHVLCDAIEFDGLSINHTASLSDVGQSTLHRFCDGTRGMQITAFASVCETLGLELVRRFSEEGLDEHLNEVCSNGLNDLLAEQYEPAKIEAWNSYVSEEWEGVESEKWEEYSTTEWPSVKDEWMASVAESNKYDLENDDDYQCCESEALSDWECEHRSEWSDEAFQEWETEEYPTWEEAYDEEHYSDWEAAETQTLRDDELTRMRECDWIILPAGS